MYPVSRLSGWTDINTIRECFRNYRYGTDIVGSIVPNYLHYPLKKNRVNATNRRIKSKGSIKTIDLLLIRRISGSKVLNIRRLTITNKKFSTQFLRYTQALTLSPLYFAHLLKENSTKKPNHFSFL